MARIVQKYGGSSVADAASIKRVARRIARARQEGNDVVVVISAMGDATDELMDLALEVSPQPQPRELDMLLTTGERQSAALLAMADGDGRYLLGMVEQILGWERLQGSGGDAEDLTAEDLTAVVTSRAPLYDKSGEEHYNLISALHKSMRGCDPDAALYWLARMLDGGEDPLYIVRRLTRFASEDVGMADPEALRTTLAAWDAYERLGSPEGELAIAQAVVHLATAPKSVAVYRGLTRARKAARGTGSLAPPAHILNAPTGLMKKLGYGEGYQYDPDAPDGFSGADYFPDDYAPPGGREPFYEPTDNGYERGVRERLARWEELRRIRRDPRAQEEH